VAVTGPEVVVLRALGLGDLLTAVPALRALRRGLPDRCLTLAAPAALIPLAFLSGAVDNVLTTPDLDRLASYGPVDLAFNLHGRGPQSHRALRRLRPRRLYAFAHPEVPEAIGPRWNDHEHEVDRWCRLVTAAGYDADPADLDLPSPSVPSPAPGAVVVHPGAGFPSRRWPPERYAQVVRALVERGETVVVTGGADEEAGRRVAALAGLDPAADLSGRTSPLELAALVAEARLVLCGDTGVGHLATAYRVPSVLLFGPTPPALWGPPPGRPEHRVLWAGRTGDPHGRVPDPGLLEISTAQVLAAADQALTELEGATS
jgi:ADP-heptose:LPS heptosyltransferase